jgi:hypothetical protein
VLTGTFWWVYSGGFIEGIVGAVHQRVLAEHGHLVLVLPPAAALTSIVAFSGSDMGQVSLSISLMVVSWICSVDVVVRNVDRIEMRSSWSSKARVNSCSLVNAAES